MTLQGINLFQLNDSTKTENRLVQPDSTQVASKKLTEYFENQSKNKLAKACNDLGAEWTDKGIRYMPGRHVDPNGNIITVNEQGLVSKTEINPNDKNNKCTIEYEYDENGNCTKETYKDNNGKAKYSEEYTTEPETKDKDNNTVYTKKTTVRDAKGNVLYIKITKTTTTWEKTGAQTYKPHDKVETSYQDNNGNEISKEDALAKRDKLRTPSMKEACKFKDSFEKDTQFGI